MTRVQRAPGGQNHQQQAPRWSVPTEASMGAGRDGKGRSGEDVGEVTEGWARARGAPHVNIY